MKVNTYTEHEITVVDGIVEIGIGKVVTSIVIKKDGGVVINYREYDDGPLKEMLAEGGIARAD